MEGTRSRKTGYELRCNRSGSEACPPSDSALPFGLEQSAGLFDKCPRHAIARAYCSGRATGKQSPPALLKPSHFAIRRSAPPALEGVTSLGPRDEAPQRGMDPPDAIAAAGRADDPRRVRKLRVAARLGRS
jgi:hypothetical protein